MLNEHIDIILSKIVSKLNNRVLKPLIWETLSTLEQNGGDEARKKIKNKVPSYC